MQSTNRQVDENPQKDWALPKEIEKRGVVKSCVDMSGRRRVGGGRSFGLSMAKNRQKNKNPSTFSLRGWLAALNPIQPNKGRCVYVIRQAGYRARDIRCLLGGGDEVCTPERGTAALGRMVV